MTDRCPMTIAEIVDDPAGAYARHRETDWWTTTAETGVDCLTMTYEAARLALRDAALAGDMVRGMDALIAMNPAIAPEYVAARAARPTSIVELEGARHQAVRALFARTFTPRRVAELKDWIDDEADRQAQALQDGDDVMTTFAARLPSAVLCALVGIPSEDCDQLSQWVEVAQMAFSPLSLLSMTTDDSLRLLEAGQSLDNYVTRLVVARRADPGHDLVSALATDPELPLDDAELAGHLAALVFAGNDTTRATIGSMLVLLADEPDIWDRAAGDDDLRGHIVEETLRLRGAAAATRRRVVEPTQVLDRPMEQDESVVVGLFAANTDPLAYDDPLAFRPRRWAEGAAPHLSLGHGAHHCMGAAVARAELRAAVRAMTQRFQLPKVKELEMRTPLGISGPSRLVLGLRRR